MPHQLSEHVRPRQAMKTDHAGVNRYSLRTMRLEAHKLRREQRLQPCRRGHHGLNPRTIPARMKHRSPCLLPIRPDVISLPRLPHHHAGSEQLWMIEVGQPSEWAVVTRQVIERAGDDRIEVDIEAAPLEVSRPEHGELSPPSLNAINIADLAPDEIKGQVSFNATPEPIDVFLPASEIVAIVYANHVEHSAWS